jgi:hypothetical protein
MAWAKLHTDILGDPKLMRAARKGARDLLYLPWFIAFAKLADDDGRLTVGGEPADPVDISALIPGGKANAVRASLASLEAIGVLVRDGDALCFARWSVRSEAKPSDSASAVAERVRRHRERVKASEGNANGNATSNARDVTPGNALHETPDNATEKRRGEKRRVRGEESGAVTASAPWVAELRARWMLRVGRVSAAGVQRELGEAVELHGAEKILGAIDRYAEDRIAVSKPAKLAWFAEEIAGWVARTDPLVDGDGVLTERGLAVAGAP